MKSNPTMLQEQAERLRGLRDALDISIRQMAEELKVDQELITRYESGEHEIPVSFMSDVAHTYQVDLTDLLSGRPSHLHMYAITRKGEGLSVQRRKDYDYWNLAARFEQRLMEPFLVRVPSKEEKDLSFNHHKGQEFIYMLEGRLEIWLDDKAFVLEPGDSIVLDSQIPHALRGLDGKDALFLDVIL